MQKLASSFWKGTIYIFLCIKLICRVEDFLHLENTDESWLENESNESLCYASMYQ